MQAKAVLETCLNKKYLPYSDKKVITRRNKQVSIFQTL